MSLAPGEWLRRATASRRSMPDFVIIGAQRAGTTSLYEWICAQDKVVPAHRKEVHYFDFYYARGTNWYRSWFPVDKPGQVTGEASPYMLFHDLSPQRAAKDLPATTRFIALLREPVDRAVSHYWHERKAGHEKESFERAIDLEPSRMRGAEEAILAGKRNYEHQHHSYASRGEYAGQLRRWFDAVGRDRVLVLETEQVTKSPDVANSILEWLDLPPSSIGFPSLNSARRSSRSRAEALEALKGHFEPHNEELFELLGRELWA
jgi:hypothetical protein